MYYNLFILAILIFFSLNLKNYWSYSVATGCYNNIFIFIPWIKGSTIP